MRFFQNSTSCAVLLGSLLIQGQAFGHSPAGELHRDQGATVSGGYHGGALTGRNTCLPIWRCQGGWCGWATSSHCPSTSETHANGPEYATQGQPDPQRASERRNWVTPPPDTEGAIVDGCTTAQDSGSCNVCCTNSFSAGFLWDGVRCLCAQ